MIGLTDSDLAAMRSDAERMLTQRALVRRRSTPGGPFTTAAEGTPCLVQLDTRRATEQTSEVAADVEANCVVLAAVGSDLERFDRLTVDGRIVELRFAHPRPVALAVWLAWVEA